MHEVEIFGQRLAQGLGHGLDAAVSDQAATDLSFDLGLELLDAALVLVLGQAVIETATAFVVLLVGFEHALEHAVEIQVP